MVPVFLKCRGYYTSLNLASLQRGELLRKNVSLVSVILASSRQNTKANVVAMFIVACFVGRATIRWINCMAKSGYRQKKSFIAFSSSYEKKGRGSPGYLCCGIRGNTVQVHPFCEMTHKKF